MTEPTDWTALLIAGATQRPEPVLAEIYLRSWQSASRPALFDCNDGQTYVVKGKQAGRMIVNDQVVAALGWSMGAPVPKPALVNVPAELIAAQHELQHLAPGVSHGTTWVPDCTDRQALTNTNADNNERFARLAALYGWIHAADHQFIYGNATPHLVHSVDHGHFFPSGPEWTVTSLQSVGPAGLDPTIEASVSWDNSQLSAVRSSMASMSDEVIASAISRPPDEWGLSSSERSELASYLSRRRDEVIARIDERMTGA